MAHAAQIQNSQAKNSILDELLAETNVTPQDEAYGITKSGLQALIKQLAGEAQNVERLDKSLIDRLIADLDQAIGVQVDAIIHHEQFKQLESSWGSLKFVIDRAAFNSFHELEIKGVNSNLVMCFPSPSTYDGVTK